MTPTENIDVPTRAYNHPSVWFGPDMARRDDWILRLDEDDVRELEDALARVKSLRIGIPKLSREDFPIPRVAGKFVGVLDELESGRGFVLIRGLPVARYTKADAALIYWGIGAHLGKAYAQNAQGEMLGHVRDVGADDGVDMKARGYQTRLNLPFHADATDVVGLLCLRTAKSGGESLIVSSTAIHNEFLSRRPDLWKVMCEPFYVDRRGEETEGQKPYYPSPVFQYLNGRLFVRYGRVYIMSGQRFPDAPRFTPKQLEALDLIDELCNDPSLHLSMWLEPGDMQFLCNHVMLHARTEYDDYSEPDRKRHLLRLWLRTPAFTELPPSYAIRNQSMLKWQSNPRPPLFDVSDIAAEFSDVLEHAAPDGLR